VPLSRTPRRRRRAASYRRIVVCLSASEASARAVGVACTLAAEKNSLLIAIAAIEVPLDVPLDTPDKAVEAAARDAVHTAQANAESYGVRVEGVVLHARDAGEAIVAEATARRAEVVVIAAEWPQVRPHTRLGRTTDHVLKHAPCRVMLIGHAAENPSQTRPTPESEPVFRAGRASDYWPTGEFVDRA